MTQRTPGPRVVFLGKTGAGKTSLINSLFDLDFTTGRSEAVTMDLQYANVAVAGRRFEIVDTPGFAESRETEEKYRELYRSLLPTADHLVWAVQSHPRVFRPDQEALIALAVGLLERVRTTVALTRADSIGPGDWDRLAGCPSSGQLLSLNEQTENVLGKLSPYLPSLTREDIVPCSPTTGYGLDALIDRIASALPVASAKD